jgi:hypothetical protein
LMVPPASPPSFLDAPGWVRAAKSTLDWPRRRRRSCGRPNQLGGQAMNDPVFAAGTVRRIAGAGVEEKQGTPLLPTAS